MRGAVIAGTDTDVGKTFVAAMLLRRLRADGVDAVPMKPTQTGAVMEAGRLRAPDLDFCLRTAGMAVSDADYELMCPYRYEPACSPHLAGHLAGHYPDVAHIVDTARTLATRHESVLVELAGGVAVPLTPDATTLDLCMALDLPVVVVARGSLGTINHTLLSVGALRQAGIDVLGVLLNDARPCAQDFVWEDNPRTIAMYGDVRILGSIPHIHEPAEGIINAHVPGYETLLACMSP